PWRIRQEMRLEMLFLLPPLTLAIAAMALVLTFPEVGDWWATWSSRPLVSGALGSLCGAFVGAGIIWFFRIAGSYGFGREAMGLGDVHLMLAIGAVLGAGGATVAFFIAPGFALLIALLSFFFRGRREIPYGPYLSMAAAAMLLFYPVIYHLQLAPASQGLVLVAEPLLQALTPTMAWICIAILAAALLWAIYSSKANVQKNDVT
ncbi:MAG TPA: A24 family peptidase, partial [Tepidisphaeraceae bacterium]